MAKYHNRLIFTFVERNTGTLVYLKQCDETQEYAVKLRKKNDTVGTVVKTTGSFSSAMHSLADEIAQNSRCFCFWEKVS